MRHTLGGDISMKRSVNLTALTVFSATAMSTAFAAKYPDSDALQIGDAKISMTQAVAAAENRVGGKVARAEYGRYKGQWVFDIEVVKDKNIMHVKVYPTNGKVIAAIQDIADRDAAHSKTE